MNRTKKISYSSMTAAITLVCLYLGTIIPKSKISFLSLASFILAIPIVAFNIKTGILVALATDIIAFLLIPRPIYMLIFIPMSFYPAVKAYLESKVKFHWIFKFIYFNLTFFAIYFVHKQLIFKSMKLEPKMFVIITIASQVIFLVYDIAFTKVVTWIISKINHIL